MLKKIAIEIEARKIATTDVPKYVAVSPFLYGRLQRAMAVESGLGLNRISMEGITVADLPLRPAVSPDLMQREADDAWMVVAE